MKHRFPIIASLVLIIFSCNNAGPDLAKSTPEQSALNLLHEADSLQEQQCYLNANEKYSLLIVSDAFKSRALQSRAKSYKAMGRADLEIEDYKSLLGMPDLSHDEKAGFAVLISNHYQAEGSTDSSIKYLQTCVKIGRQDDGGDQYAKLVYPLLSELYIQCKNWDMAFQMIDSARKHHVRLIETMLPRAEIFAEIGELDSALYWATYAIDHAEALPHEMIDCHLLRFWIYSAQGEQGLASQELKAAKNIEENIKNHPEFPANWLSAALMEE